MCGRVAAIVSCAAWAAIAAVVITPAGEPKKPKPVSEKVREAWQKAGFISGWMEERTLRFYPDTVGGPMGQVPYFSVDSWKVGVVAGLPQPEEGFGLDVSNAEVTDAVLSEIAGLKKLHSLHLGGWKVTATGLKHLSALESLRALTLIGGTLTDAGLKHLAECKNLRKLGLIETEITDGLSRFKNLHSLRLATEISATGLEQLAELKNLQELSLYLGKESDAKVSQLSRFKYLRNLEVYSSALTDANLKYVTGLTKLQALGISHTEVTDVGLKQLADLPILQELKIRDSLVTNEGLKHLANLKSLRILVLFANPTEEDVAKIQRAFPKLKIVCVVQRTVQ